MKTLRPLFFFVSLLLVVGMACSFSSPPATQAPPTDQPIPVNDPTSAVPPTEVPPTEEPTEAPLPTATEAPVQAQQFFTEEFDTPLSSDWTPRIEFAHPNLTESDEVTVQVDDGNLVWDFDNEGVFYYLLYNAYEYDDVVLELHSENRGKNNNNVSLICRYDPEVGWYEFNIANNGLYWIYFARVLDNGKIEYNRIANGGSTYIKAGLEVNEYYAKCEGNELTLKINGQDVTSIQDKKYAHDSGQVGVSVSSFNVLPIRIEMDWFKISEP